MDNTRASLLLEIRDVKNDRAWSLFAEIYGPLLRGWCVKSGLQPADADEVAQAVLEKVSKEIQNFQYDPARGRFRGWLFTITKNQIADLRDGQKSQQRQLDRLREGLGQRGVERLLPAVREHLVGDGRWRPRNEVAGAPPAAQPDEAEQAWEEAFQIHLFREAFRLLRDEGELDERTAQVIEFWWKDEETGPAQARAQLNLSYPREAAIRSQALRKIAAKMLELGEDSPWLQMT